MGAEVIILFNPYTYNFLKGLTHSALVLFKLLVTLHNPRHHLNSNRAKDCDKLFECGQTSCTCRPEEG